MAYIFQTTDPSQSQPTTATTAVPEIQPQTAASDSALTTLLYGVPLLIIVAAWVIVRSIKTKDVIVPDKIESQSNLIAKERATKRAAETQPQMSTVKTVSQSKVAATVSEESAQIAERANREAAETRARQLAMKERKRQKRLTKQAMQANASSAKSDRLATPAGFGASRNAAKPGSDDASSESVSDKSIHVPMVVRTAIAKPDESADFDSDEEIEMSQPRVSAVALTTSINATRMQLQEKNRKREPSARKPEKVVTSGFMKFDRVVHERREVAPVSMGENSYVSKATESGSPFESTSPSASDENDSSNAQEPRTLKDFIRKES
jgi:hypothetical protein